MLPDAITKYRESFLRFICGLLHLFSMLRTIAEVRIYLEFNEGSVETQVLHTTRLFRATIVLSMRLRACLDWVEEAWQLCTGPVSSWMSLNAQPVFGRDASDRNGYPSARLSTGFKIRNRVPEGTNYHFAGIKSFGRGLFVA